MANEPEPRRMPAHKLMIAWRWECPICGHRDLGPGLGGMPLYDRQWLVCPGCGDLLTEGPDSSLVVPALAQLLALSHAQRQDLAELQAWVRRTRPSALFRP